MTATLNVSKKRKPIYLSINSDESQLKKVTYQLFRAKCVVVRLTNILMDNEHKYFLFVIFVSALVFTSYCLMVV